MSNEWPNLTTFASALVGSGISLGAIWQACQRWVERKDRLKRESEKLRLDEQSARSHAALEERQEESKQKEFLQGLSNDVLRVLNKDREELRIEIVRIKAEARQDLEWRDERIEELEKRNNELTHLREEALREARHAQRNREMVTQILEYNGIDLSKLKPLGM